MFPLLQLPFLCIQEVTDQWELVQLKIELDLKSPLTDNQLILFIDWLNGIKTEIREVCIDSFSRRMFEIFMNRFQRSIEDLEVYELIFSDVEREPINSNRLNFEIQRSFFVDCSEWFNLEFLLSMDSEQILANGMKLSAEDMNVFLRSWQEGKTNRNLKMLKITTGSTSDMKKVVKDCGAELIDPRTAKFKHTHFRDRESHDRWICGGIHIRRNDGRLAIIQTRNHEYLTEDENITQEQIQKYLVEKEIWNSEKNHEEWYKKWLGVYFI
uniref:F-box domain-containing protein n=1 Tax=Caenorhabditis tropicalis TaxID=1561998 RepID=A0A1I7V1B7_9PELO